MNRKELDQIKETMCGTKGPNEPQKALGLSTGSTLLNLALTGQTLWGLDSGCYYLLVGSSSSGKTFAVLTALAEASINPTFANHRLIYDAPERGARMNIRKFFGPNLEKRMEWLHSKTVEEFYYQMDDALQGKKPFVYVLDSESALSSESEEEKFQEGKKAFLKGKGAPGSYGDGKAKKHSSYLRQVVSGLGDTNSMLLLVAQTRDNIGFGAQYNPEIRSGGRALTFYATAEIWFKEKKELKKRVKLADEKIGSQIQVRVKKNRDTGLEPTFDLFHYVDGGLSDTDSICHFLVERGRWKDKDGIILAKDLEVEMEMEDLIQHIEDKGREAELKDIAKTLWEEIREACRVGRKSRYNIKE